MRKLRDEQFTVLDLETTGGRPEISGVLEIGMVKIQKGKLTEKLSSLINPGYPIPPIVRRMTGIRESMVRDAPPFEALAEQVIDFIGCDIVVLHNSPFDLQFLNFHVEKLGKAPFTNPMLCTVRLGHVLVPEAANRRLETLARHLEIPFEAHHRAWSDAEVTAKLFLIYLDLLENKGVETFYQLFRWMEENPPQFNKPAEQAPAEQNGNPPSGDP